MSCLFRCPKCKAGKRFETTKVYLFTEGGMYLYAPITKRIECPCGHVFLVEVNTNA